MKYEIEYSEVVERINSITIEVEDEDEGYEIADILAERSVDFYHPDDIFEALNEMDVKVAESSRGAEQVTYEIL